MSRGRETLERIDDQIADIRAEEARLSARMGETTEQLRRLREQELACFRDLAQHRLGSEARAGLGGALDRAEAEARRRIADREAMLASLHRDAETLAKKIAELKADRGRLSVQVAERRQAMEEADVALIARLKRESEEYNARLRAAEAAEMIAVQAERKAELAREDRVEKGRPYEADQLYMYLWQRRYGTRDYRGHGLIRALDGWVARLVRYHQARPNYATLLELPERLGEHAQRARQAAEAEARKLAAYEAEQRARAGNLGLEKEANEADARLAALDQAIAAKESEHRDLDGKRTAILRGEDDASQAAVGALAEALKNTELGRLHRAAMLTPEPEDEAIVSRIDDLRDDIEDAEEDLEERRGLHRDLERKRNELEEVRSKFQHERYDDERWEFDDDDVEDFLKALLRGVINGAVLWEAMRRRGRYTPGPTGSQGPWGRVPGGSIRLPRSRTGRSKGADRGGGFRTGGGFGGGRSGHRTGGRF
jgi:hypothetical protein